MRPAAAIAAGLTLVLWGIGCARQGTVPGGPPDRVPPIVVGVDPEPGLVGPDWDGSVRIRFNERISERSQAGSLDDAVVISPELEGARVSHSRDGLEITAPGGFPEGRVYVVTVLPVVSDLFQNRMRDPFEFVFSTGAEIPEAVVAGAVSDRITGQPVEVRVEAVTEDSTVYHTRSATGSGVFALRHLPIGRFTVRAYQDNNRNGRPDFSEVQASRPVGLGSPTDTLILALEVLQPDSTPARVVRAEALDSVSVRVELDDFLDPSESVRLVGASLMADTAAQDSTMVQDPAALPELDRVLHEHEFATFQAQMAELRRLEQQTPADTGVAAAPEPPRTDPETAAPDGPPRPAQSLVVIFDRPLQPRFPYRIALTGLRNIASLPLGGGDAAFVWNPPVPAGADSLAADTSGILPDTGVSPPDSSPPPPDTTSPPDTLRHPAGIIGPSERP